MPMERDRHRRRWSASPHRQARSAVIVAGVDIDGSVIGERAGCRHRGLLKRSNVAPEPIEASPVRALFDPSAVLSSMKASFPLRNNCAPAARLLISPLLNSIALSKFSPTVPLRTPAVPNPALPEVTSSSAWFVPSEPSGRSRPYYRATPPSPRPTPRAWQVPRMRKLLLVSVPATVRLDPPSPPLLSTSCFRDRRARQLSKARPVVEREGAVDVRKSPCSARSTPAPCCPR